MTMTFQAIAGGTTYDLNDGNPFRLESVDGAGPSPVMRFGQRSPLQNGVTDLGYRLGARSIVLSLNFYATTDALLDTARQTLHAIFKPTTSTPIQLRITRDDGTIRQLFCHATDKTAVTFDRELRPGHAHRATVNLMAANPKWQQASSTRETFSGTTTTWWTANGVIGSATVMEHVEWPTQGQLWTYAGTITGEWTVAFRSGQETGSGTKTAFRVGTADDNNDPKLWWFGGDSWAFDQTHTLVGSLPSGTQNYMLTKQTSFNTTTLWYAGNQSWFQELGQDHDISGTARTWRSAPGSAAATRWSSEFPKAAVYNYALSASDMTSLDAWMSGTAILGSVTTVNSGDFNSYPLIAIQGPIINPKLTNVTTGKVIDLTGFTLGSSDIYYVDLTTGDKTIYDAAGSSVMSTMGTPSQLAQFYLAPSPAVSGGTNTIRVQGGSTSTSTQVIFTHTNEYWSI